MSSFDDLQRISLASSASPSYSGYCDDQNNPLNESELLILLINEARAFVQLCHPERIILTIGEPPEGWTKEQPMNWPDSLSAMATIGMIYRLSERGAIIRVLNRN